MVARRGETLQLEGFYPGSSNKQSHRLGKEGGKRMASSRRPVTTLTAVSFVYLLALFGSHCQMAPAVAGATRGWTIGTGLKYELSATVLFREVGPTKPGGDVGFQLTGELDVGAVWRDPVDPDMFLLKIELLSPQLWIKSRKAPEPEGFIRHSSKVDEAAKKPVYVLWKNGGIRALYLDASESVSSRNLKRGLVSIFQYKILDDEIEEKDACGLCAVTYTSLGPSTMEKHKSFCKLGSLPPRKEHPNNIFNVEVTSLRNATYALTPSLLLQTIRDEEKHQLIVTAMPEVGVVITSTKSLKQTSALSSVKTVEANSVENAIGLLEVGYREISIELELEQSTCPESGCPVLEQTIEEYRSALDNTAVGTVKSATAFLKLISLVQSASSEQLDVLLKSPRYRQLKMQLLDVFGSASTLTAHRAAMKVLKQDEKGDEMERYLWALSMSPAPHADIVKDILKRSEEIMQNDKLSETFALTAAATARHHGCPKLIEITRLSLELGLDTCTGERCQSKFLRALRNLKSKASIPKLLKYTEERSKSVHVTAWIALKALPKEYVTSEVKRAAAKAFYQLGGFVVDSSARTLALDVLIENDPSKEELEDLVEYLASADPAYEVRRYLLERFEQLSAKSEIFARNLKVAFKLADKKVYNYHVMAQKGFSTAFSRNFLNTTGSKGNLVTIQEVNAGLLKRGTVDVMLETADHEQAMFSLGLFARGLSTFVSSDEKHDSENTVELATGGMEIDILGVGIRPFEFFSGQGELMGHVWSGTASERTPAFQALASLYSHSEYVSLSTGFVAEFNGQGAMSFDLAGQVQLSLWSRNAQSLVDVQAGTVIQGGSKIRSNFVQSMAEFSMTMEPKLELATNVDFSNQVSLCMKLSQPETTVKYNIYKVERTGSRHKLRKTRRIQVHSPGRSYLLNKKNNEMCAKVR